MSSPSAALVEVGKFHRLGLAVEDASASAERYRRVLGAAPLAETGPPDQTPSDRSEAGGVEDLEGADTRMLRHGGYPAILLAASDPASVVGRFLQRWGPGLHSVAWEIPDMWTSENRLRRRNIRIAAVNITGRHFFMHPADTHGVLMEWTDTFFPDDLRPGPGPDGVLDPMAVRPAPSEGGGVVGGASLAWVTAVVADAEATGALLAEVAGARTVAGNARRDEGVEQTVDVAIGDITLRLVTPRSTRSRYREVLAGGPRLWSYALRVPDLDAALGSLEAEGVETLGRDGNLQVHGGTAQGVAQALFEEFVYDADGNPLTATFADYSMPAASELPFFESIMIETPSPNNLLGAKGIGESGTVGAPPAVQSAVVDALSHLGVRHIDMPCTPERVWRAIRAAEGARR